MSMGKDFLNLKTEPKRLYVFILCTGIIITIGMGVNAYRDSALQNGYELTKKKAGEGSYEQEVIARIEGMKKIPMTVAVEEQRLTKEEAQAELERAGLLLDDILKGENESLTAITKNLNFTDHVPGTCVEVEWISGFSEYFYSDGMLREDAELREPLELKLSAILSCQEYTEDYEVAIILLPTKEPQRELLRLIEQEAARTPEKETLILPGEYQGKAITWKKPPDYTFLYFLLFTVGAAVFLKLGAKRDAKLKQKQRLEQMEKDYAQIVSKFTMLLSAGLSVRNAWERIVMLYRRGSEQKKPVYEEMSRALREMQKGISELEVYESFGTRVGQVHYKKLMALFVSEKRRGSINLPEAMNQEMLQAWEEQKRKTRQQGEKIGTKLLIPMMGMLAVVFIMILVPAFLSFQL